MSRSWWHRWVGRWRKHFTVPFRLYSRDGNRSIEVRVYSDGDAYFVEQERGEGDTFANRDGAVEHGPYRTAEVAEAAAVVRPWFNQGTDT